MTTTYHLWRFSFIQTMLSKEFSCKKLDFLESFKMFVPQLKNFISFWLMLDGTQVVLLL